MIPTPHIEVTDKNKFAKTVLMPGDPLRAKYIAQNFLADVEVINQVRNMLGYTGYYQGKKVTVFASGMGLSSIGIYSYELFRFYDVDNIIRVGSAGAYTEKLKMYDIVLAGDAYSETNFARVQNPQCDSDIMTADPELVKRLEQSAQKQQIPYTKGRIHSCEVFYKQDPNYFQQIANEKNCLCVEMEAFALFHNAKVTGKHAACILTISDSLVTHEATTAAEREQSFSGMVKIALESVGI